MSGPQGDAYDLEKVFEELNQAHFHGWMAQPLLGWSRRPSRVMLGHYDPSHNAIILSRLLDSPRVPRLAVEYVLFHEMLHLQVSRGTSRRAPMRPHARIQGSREGISTAQRSQADP